MAHNADLVYTADKNFYLPDVEVKEPKPSYHYEPLRGYGSVLAVIENNIPVGWILSETLGYTTVKEYMTRQK